MAAYMAITAHIFDRERFVNGYAKKAAPIARKFGGKYTLLAPGAELQEDGSGGCASVVVSEWPDKEAAMRFWNSDEYAEAKKLREGINQCQAILIEAPDIEPELVQ